MGRWDALALLALSPMGLSENGIYLLSDMAISWEKQYD
jgi:hypothetical protein